MGEKGEIDCEWLIRLLKKVEQGIFVRVRDKEVIHVKVRIYTSG